MQSANKHQLDPVRRRLLELVEEKNTNLAELSKAIGRNHAYLHQFINRHTPRRLPDDAREALASLLNVPETELGASMKTRPATKLPQFRAETFGRKDLPVFVSAQGGNGEMLISYEPIEYKERPSILENVPDAYAMYVVNDSMEPRYSQGELLLIHPHKPARPGNDVLVVMTADGHEHNAMIKRLTRRTDTELILQQFNPHKELKIPLNQVQNIHLVIGAYWQV